jgi:hypothetical protein
MLENPIRKHTKIRQPSSLKKRYAAALRHALEPLEPRQLLSVDLHGTFITEPTTAFSGAKQAVSVSVTNGGDARAVGTLSINYYAALDGQTFDPNTAFAIGRITKFVSLASGSSVIVNYTVALSAAMSAGTYRLYAVLDTANKFLESDETNNVAESASFAVAQPDYSLVTAFNSKTSLVPSVVAGLQTNAVVRIVITNSSGATVRLLAGQKVAVQIVARPVGAVDDSQDVLLNRSVCNASVSLLKPGQSRTQSINIRFPETLAEGTYDILVKVDTGNALAETVEDDNQATFGPTVLVAQPFTDPALTFNSATSIPTDVVADGRALPLKLNVTNYGNVKIPSGQTSSIAIVAHCLEDSSDTTLKTFPISLSGLASGKTKTFKLSPAILNTLADGNYQIQALLATTSPGDLAPNDAVSCTTSTMSVGPAFYNLNTLAPSASFSPSVVSGTAVTGTVSVRVQNLSNTYIPSGKYASISVILRPVGAIDETRDVTIGTIPQASLANLPIGATRTFRVSSTIPASTPNGDYQIITTVTPSNLVEAYYDDNSATGPTVTLAQPFLDLAITSAAEKFPTPAAAGSSAIGTVVIRNLGNTPFQGSVTVQFFGTADGSSIPFTMGSGTFLVSLQPGASTFALASALTLNLPNFATLARSATVQARLAINDANSDDNLCPAGTIIISSQYVDLYVASATNPFSGTLPAGATASASIAVGNLGSGVAAGPVTVSYYASLTSTIDSSAVLLGTTTFSVGLFGVQRTDYIPLTLTLPTPDALTSYKILATLSADLTIDNNPNNNLTAVLGTVSVQPPPPP